MKTIAVVLITFAFGLAAGSATFMMTARHAPAADVACHRCASPHAAPVATPLPAAVATNAVVKPAAPPLAIPSLDESLAQQQLADMSVLLRQLEADAAGLQQRLDAAEAERDALQANKRPERESFQDRMARMQADEPERFKEMQERRASFTEQIQTAQLDRTEFLSGLNTDNMSEEQFAAHNELMTRLDEMTTVTSAFAEGRFPSREERGVLRENIGAVRQLYEVEREFVLQEVGRDLGMDDTAASEFGTYMGTVYDLTALKLPSFHGSRGGRGQTPSAPPAAAPADRN